MNITHRDKVFVLGINIPQELQGDIYEMYEQNEEVRIGNPEELFEMMQKREALRAKKMKTQMKKTQSKKRQDVLNESEELNSEHNEGSTMTAGDDESEQPKYAYNKKIQDESEQLVLGLKLGNIQNSPQIQSITKKLEKKINQIEKAVE